MNILIYTKQLGKEYLSSSVDLTQRCKTFRSSTCTQVTHDKLQNSNVKSSSCLTYKHVGLPHHFSVEEALGRRHAVHSSLATGHALHTTATLPNSLVEEGLCYAMIAETYLQRLATSQVQSCFQLHDVCWMFDPHDTHHACNPCQGNERG